MSDKNEIFNELKAAPNFAREKIFARHFPDAYREIMSIVFPDGFTFTQKLYHYLHDDMSLKLGVCPVCGNRCKFVSLNQGYIQYCSKKCSYSNEAQSMRIEKIRKTNLERYGVENPMQSAAVRNKSLETKLERYGDRNYNNRNKYKGTCIERYGVENPLKDDTIRDKSKRTCVEHYGAENPFASKIVKERIRHTNLERYGTEYYQQTDDRRERVRAAYEAKGDDEKNGIERRRRETNLKRYGVADYNNVEKGKQTCIERYGTEYYQQTDEFKERVGETWRNKTKTELDAVREKHMESWDRKSDDEKKAILRNRELTNIDRFGVPWACMRPEARAHHTISKTNLAFAKQLDEKGIAYETEFPIDSYSYDFKVGDTLIEINPTITHNSHLNIFGGEPMSKDYHSNKSKCASDNGYHCIHVWDWDDWNKIISILKPKQTLYARKLELREVGEAECDAFLNEYHLQGSCKGQSIRLGLYMNDILVELMTFGKPRYNKNYEYELLRLCSHSDYMVVGGAERLFKRFVEQYNPASVISYCDASKFDGKVYGRLGFKAKGAKPSKHWYNLNSNQHITDNLLRQRGFDQLFNASYGKGTSNEELMLEHGFLPVYDCGQRGYVFINK